MSVTVKFTKNGAQQLLTNLPQKDRKPIGEAVRTLYLRIVEGDHNLGSKKKNKVGRWKDFARALKLSLDQSFGPQWHVLACTTCGFHFRYNEFAKFSISGGKDLKSNESLTVIIWKSPGDEPLTSGNGQTDAKTIEPSNESVVVGDDSAVEASGNDKSDEPESTSATSRFHLLQPSEKEIEAGSEIETSVNVLRDALQSAQAAHLTDIADLAKFVRKRLTEEQGPIWHVVTGEYALEHAEDCEVSVTASLAKDKITCFRHKQTRGRIIDWYRLASSIPYAVVLFVCFAYMGFHSVCRRDASSDAASLETYRSKNWFKRAIENNICSKPDWDFELGVIAVITIVSSFLAKRFLKKS